MALSPTDWPRIIADPSIAEVWNTETGDVWRVAYAASGRFVRWRDDTPGARTSCYFNVQGGNPFHPYAIRLRTPEPVECQHCNWTAPGDDGRYWVCQDCGLSTLTPPFRMVAPEPVSPSMARLSGTIDRIEAEQSALKPVAKTMAEAIRDINAANGLCEPIAPAEIPEWAKVMVCELANAEAGYIVTKVTSVAADLGPFGNAFARYLAKHEKEPEPDPLAEVMRPVRGYVSRTDEEIADHLRAELAKRGLEVGRVK